MIFLPEAQACRKLRQLMAETADSHGRYRSMAMPSMLDSIRCPKVLAGELVGVCSKQAQKDALKNEASAFL